MTGLLNLLCEVPDPRAGNSTHRLGDVLVIVLAAALCGQTKATEIALFAQHRREALSRLVRFERPPSHDTISRLLRLIEPGALSALLTRFAAALAEAVAACGGPETVAMDGKAMRRAVEAAEAHAPPMTVTAFAAEARLVLGATGGGSETGGLCHLVELLDLKGKTVTADALHCNHNAAAALTGAGADYVLGLKKNRPTWYDEAAALFAARPPEEARTETRAHGRRETRAAAVTAAPTPRAAGHRAYGRVVSERNGAPPVTRYFLLSRCLAPEELARLVRAHWQIENAVHWVLDVHLGEDALRARRDHAPANAALLNRIARNILQTADTPNVPISHRIRKCMWNDNYLAAAFTHMR